MQPGSETGAIRDFVPLAHNRQQTSCPRIIILCVRDMGVITRIKSLEFSQ